MKIKQGFKYRIYPNQTQQERLAIQFGHTRYIYNLYLHTRTEYYRLTGQSSNYYTCANDLKLLKSEPDHLWLKEADSQVLQQSLKDLDTAFKNFFTGRAKYPNFKRKFGKQSIRYPQRFKIEGNRLYLPKVGWVKITLQRPIIGKMRNVTISKTKTGKYFASIICEFEKEEPVHPSEKAIGIDLGLTHFAILSNGEKIDSSRYLRRSERRLKVRQRRLSRKQRGSNNRHKARLVVALTHEKVANQRRDFHHQQSCRLVQAYGHIAVEDLNVKGMVKNHNLAKSIQDAGWSQFVQFLTYKQQMAGGTLTKIDRWFPSSKTCFVCGGKNQELTRKQRDWTCLRCGTYHDRDVNAALNILDQSTVGATESYALEIRSAVTQSAKEAQKL